MKWGFCYILVLFLLFKIYINVKKFMEQILEKKKLQFSFLEKRRRNEEMRKIPIPILFNSILCRYCCRK